ncbi:MAG TPA: hypothetical protein VLA23_09380 [Candidatus Limnocylindrales bacterium]|nr:hypothetical protein [Candidatus Limnocylindrales bacterium]
MSWPAVVVVALAILVVVAAVVAVTASDRRLALVGLAAALSLAPLVADPLPDPLVVAIRIVGAALAAYLVRIPLRDAGPGRGSRIGWPAEAAAAAAAFVAGFAASSTGLAGSGPAAATAAAFAVGAVVLVPLADQRDPGRTGLALLLAIMAADLLRVGLGDPGTPGSLTVTAAMVALATAVAAMLMAREERHHGTSGTVVPGKGTEDEP